MSLRMSPFKALYGYDAPSFIDLDFRESREPKGKDWLEESQDTLKEIKENFQVTQNQQNIYENRNRLERRFEIGDMVFL